jgi:hypothetical protein
MESLQSTATRTLRTMLELQPTSPAKVAFAWRIVAGATFARVAVPTWTEDGVLRLRAKDAAWRREIERARPLMAARLKELLGPGVVRSIVIERSRQ